MDRLMALQAFARVVELGGFTKASDSLQMPKTTVSDLVQSLEKHLGARLLQRTTRRVSVTAEGGRVLRALRAHPCGSHNAVSSFTRRVQVVCPCECMDVAANPIRFVDQR
jgi:hypothetical protein